MVVALMVGAGEYTTGHVPTVSGAASDKYAGVVCITLMDLRRLGIVDRLVLCDAVGTKMPAVRNTLQRKIGDVYKDMHSEIESFPADDVAFDGKAYLEAMKTMNKGDVVTIFTPDDTHFEIAMAAIAHGLHVLIAKPAVKTLRHHLQLCEAAKNSGVLVAVEFHKRFDPMYSDARNRIRRLGGFSFFSSLMTQPKKQLDTFRSWAGKSSDISYYLNSHHIDIHNWSVEHRARPVRVVAMAGRGVANRVLGGGVDTEDTISLMTQWEDLTDGSVGIALYTSSWIAPPSDCHTQQHFHYMGHSGEVHVDQAHRGYTLSTDDAGFASINPLYMSYTPDLQGYFAGQDGYGYQSIAQFVDAAVAINQGKSSKHDFLQSGKLALIETTLPVTAVLQAGRLSLDNSGAAVHIHFDANSGLPCGLSVAS